MLQSSHTAHQCHSPAVQQPHSPTLSTYPGLQHAGVVVRANRVRGFGGQLQQSPASEGGLCCRPRLAPWADGQGGQPGRAGRAGRQGGQAGQVAKAGS